MGTHPIFESDFDCLTGRMEFIELIKTPNVDGVRLLDASGRVDCQGLLVLTGHQFIFSSGSREIFVLHKMVDNVEKENEKGRIQLAVRLKSGRLIRFLLNSQTEADNVSESILLCGMVKFRDSFPFYYNPPRSYENLPEFPISTTAQWFKTLRNKRWRLCDRNKNGTLCPTYGEHSVVPSSVKDDVLAKSVRFRDGMRFPVLSCLAGNQQNPLLRCSSVGFMEARNKYDEDILRAISNGQKGVLIDLRPAAIIRELRNKKKGLETDSSYPLYRKEYPALDNRYSVHDAFCKCWDAIEAKSDDFLDKLRKSNWLGIVDNVLRAASMTAQALLQAPVVLHGGEGRDMTLVISSLTQVILLPEARTVKGFLSVVQREWIEAGHPFYDRLRSSAWSPKSAMSGKEGSTWQLFLHATQHLLVTHPLHFQFNSAFLLELHDTAVASEYGNFLANCEQERKDANVKNKTYSVWPILNAEKFVNPLYEVPQATPAWPLSPCDLWRQYWCRYQSQSGHVTSTSEAQMEALQHLVLTNRSLKERMTELAQQQRAMR